MFKYTKSIVVAIIALLAVTIIAGCNGPPRPGFGNPYNRYNNGAAEVAKAKAEAAAAKAEAAAAKAELEATK